MKKLIVLLILITPALMADEVRVSVLFVHYSVGAQMTYGYCYNDTYNNNIREALDTAHVAVDGDTARIVYRSYYTIIENELRGLSDTLHGYLEGGCWENRFDNYNYKLVEPVNRVIIWASWDGVTNQYAGLLKYMLDVPNKQDSVFWNLFQPHQVPGSSGDNVSEHYNLVIIKKPYKCWGYMSQNQADSIKHFYEVVRDSVLNHPEINLAFAFGTPLRMGHYGITDTAQAKITYEMANWFASDSFFTHDNNGL